MQRNNSVRRNVRKSNTGRTEKRKYNEVGSRRDRGRDERKRKHEFLPDEALLPLRDLDSESAIYRFICSKMRIIECIIDESSGIPNSFELLIEKFDIISGMPGEVLFILKAILKSKMFSPSGSVIKYVTCKSKRTWLPHQVTLTLCRILNLSERLLKRLPKAALFRLAFVVSSFDQCFNAFANLDRQLQETLQRVKKLQAQTMEDVFNQHARDECATENLEITRQSLIPTVEDLRCELLIEENHVNEDYKSTGHYLNTQFQLLREDFIRPIRNGVREYLASLEGGKYTCIKRLQDAYIYHGVSIRRLTSVDVLVVKFSVKRLNRIRSQNCKRFIYGSLVCLSADRFQSMIVATVENRHPDDLEKGFVEVKIVSPLTSLPANYRNLEYVLIEGQSYFEAYRHTLSRIQDFKNDDRNGVTIPFSKYFVHPRSITCQCPYYGIQDKSSYGEAEEKNDDNICIKKPRLSLDEGISFPLKFDGENYLSEGELEEGEIREGELEIGELEIGELEEKDDKAKDVLMLDLNCLGKSRNLSINQHDFKNFQCWPNAEKTDLDASQLSALHHALNTEVAIIQGPPGTGKTFIGVKIVEFLLDNVSLWKSRIDSKHKGQIMIVCYTNHALDQFLTEIVSLRNFKSEVVRIGGQCKSDNLAQFTLRQHRRRYIYEKKDVVAVEEQLREILGLSEHLASKLGIGDKINVFHVTVSDLVQHMSYRHRQQLTTVPKSTIQETIIYWLLGRNIPTIVKIKFGDKTNKRKCLKGDLLAELFGAASKIIAPDINIGQNIQSESSDDNASGKLYDANDSIVIKEEADLITDERMIIDDPRNDIFESENITDITQQFNADSLCNSDSLKDSLWRAEDLLEELSNINKMVAKHPQAMLSQNDFDDQASADIWSLGCRNRLALYLYWYNSARKEWERQYNYTRYMCQMLQKEKSYAYEQIDKLIVKNADIIALTTTGAAKFSALIEKSRPNIAIVEEAAEILEAHVLTSLTNDCRHLILIGDHKQLRPKPTNFELAKEYNLDVSFFERLIRSNHTVKSLELQHRMRPDISCLLVPHIYDTLIDHESVKNYPAVKGVENNIFFLNHSNSEEKQTEGRSHSNIYEADFVVELCYYLLQQGYKAKQITILSPYVGQMSAKKKKVPTDVFEGVRVIVIDNFQGEENDIIIFSFVRSNKEGKLGFLNSPNRICVSLSRAKQGFYCIGNFEMYARKNKTWRSIMEKLKCDGKTGKSMILCCQNHSNKTAVVCAKDFQMCHLGGCTEMCSLPMYCGHECSFKCHTIDTRHASQLICQKLCLRKCVQGHPCPLRCDVQCGKDFGQCDEICGRILPCLHNCKRSCSTVCVCDEKCDNYLECGHRCQERCSSAKCTEKCKRICKKTLPCSHACKNLCYQSCNLFPCKNSVLEKLECSHVIRRLCYEQKSQADCDALVSTTLSCSHDVIVKCHMLLNKANIICKEFVDHTLECGHTIKHECYRFVTRADCTFKIMAELPCNHKKRIYCKELLEISKVKCEELVEVDLPDCEHRLQKRCCEPSECKEMVKSTLTCGHTIKKLCVTHISSIECTAIVTATLPCSHTAKMECWSADISNPIGESSFPLCKQKCLKTLMCGHTCLKMCFEKCDPCYEKCSKLLKCGHKCKNKCSSSCGPCEEKCQATCLHIISCKNKCSDPCLMCCSGCLWECSHQKCPKLCFEVCDRPVCNESCPVLLCCGHVCMGYCGEPCPYVCNACGLEKVIEPSESEMDRYVTIFPCNHYFKRSLLDIHMKEIERDGFDVIKLRLCPNKDCSTPIMFCPRYNSAIKAFFIAKYDLEFTRLYDCEDILRCRVCGK